MKKLRLRALDLGAKEVLSREQLKHILGGDGSGGIGGSGSGCTNPTECNGFTTCINGVCTDPLGGGSGSGGSGGGGITCGLWHCTIEGVFTTVCQSTNPSVGDCDLGGTCTC